MSTSELESMLRLAAKAAGIRVIRSRLDDPMNRDFLIANSPRNPHGVYGAWNPDADDGDALRLAVKLRLFMDVTEVASGAGGQGCAWRSELHGDDPCAATRRAIWRAAAEIGSAMP